MSWIDTEELGQELFEEILEELKKIRVILEDKNEKTNKN
jgi:hypothetical protein